MINLLEFKNAQLDTLDALGIPCVYRMTKAPKTTFITTIGFKTAGVRDEAIVNSYGVGAKVLTAKASDFVVAPVKYDRFTFVGGAETYTADSVQPIHIGTEVVFYKIFIKGK